MKAPILNFHVGARRVTGESSGIFCTAQRNILILNALPPAHHGGKGAVLV